MDFCYAKSRDLWYAGAIDEGKGSRPAAMESISHTVLPEEDGCSVRHILKAVLHFSTHAVARLTRVADGIQVNGQHARTIDIVHTGDVVTAQTGDHRSPKIQPTPGNWALPVVWEDEHLLVVNKPAGMTAHASNFLPDTPTVAGALAWSRGSDFIFHSVNRLDKGTTGLMVVAKSGYVHDRLRRMLHTGDFFREYRAVCVGCPPKAEGVIDAPIGRDETSTVRRCVRPDGSPARTSYQVLAHKGPLTLVRLLPQTGRTHQLRVHMAFIGCPLAGDWLYGTEDPALIPRPALHACAITLTHPITGQALHLTAPLPEDMARLIPEPSTKGETTMLTWNVTYHCKRGQRDAFYQAITDLGVAANSRQEDGNLKYDYFFAAEDPDSLLLVESWTEPALQQAHCQTEVFAKLQALKAEYCETVTIDKFGDNG